MPTSQTALQGVSVLVVDDNDDLLEMLALILLRSGAEVMAASSVTGALAWLERRVPSAVLTDLSMPGQDGYRLLEHTRLALPSLPVVAMTATAHAEGRAHALEAGFAGYLPKPFSPELLIESLGRLLVR